MSLTNIFESIQYLEDHFQIILIFNKVNVLSVESKANLYHWICMINQTDEFCSKYKQAMNENKFKFHITKLKDCKIIDDVLFKKDLLWISENMHTKLLQEVHDQSSIFHFNNKWIINLVQRFYYWSNHQVIIWWYIWNYHACQRSKVSKNNISELYHFLLISQKHWKDIIMNFITELFLSEDYNVICIIICCFIKEHHYVFCHWKNDDISVEEMIWIMLWNVYQLHDLLSFIVSDIDFQFISTMWKNLCKWLKITANLFTVYHSKINDQTKWINQDIEHELKIYCNYMQNDWVKWIFMMKFSNNFNIFLIISMISFYFNKDFHSRMSFNSDMIDYEIIHEQLKVKKANDIIIWMKELLSFDHQQLKKMKLIIEIQINKHRQNVIYEIDDWVWLFFRNVKITRSCKDLKNKQLKSYQIIIKAKIFYHFYLSISMKHLHSMFSLKLLQLYSENSLSEQHAEFLKLIIIDDNNNKHWKINNILNFKHYQDWIQYKIK